MSTHNMCLYAEMEKKNLRIIIKYSSLTSPLSILLIPDCLKRLLSFWGLARDGEKPNIT